MRHFASPKFWAAHEALPPSVRELADANYKLLKRDPRHPSLQFKKVGRYWSVLVGLRYRALAVEAWWWTGEVAAELGVAAWLDRAAQRAERLAVNAGPRGDGLRRALAARMDGWGA